MNKPCSVHFQYRADCEACKLTNKNKGQIYYDDDNCLVGSLPTSSDIAGLYDSASVSSPDLSLSCDTGSSSDSFGGGDSGGGGSSGDF